MHVPGSDPGINPLLHACAISKSVVQPAVSCVARKPDSPMGGNAEGVISRLHPKIFGLLTFHLFALGTHFLRRLPFLMRMAIGEGTSLEASVRRREASLCALRPVNHEFFSLQYHFESVR